MHCYRLKIFENEKFFESHIFDLIFFYFMMHLIFLSRGNTTHMAKIDPLIDSKYYPDINSVTNIQKFSTIWSH